MYLKRLEIVGFKSFADAFELEFREGISCIVGPNGCGKSNIADAIRWVLGCQSPSELRAERMEDVIFSGTATRKPQGMAEVVLTLDNSRRELPLDFDEISITRRLFRSGESEYLINGNKSRLMDLTDLLVDRGLGNKGYWILEKNMTQAIIEKGPADRRFLFDEAAGIVKYKLQRHRAELKLRAVAEDLERLDDIISEVERNVRQLKKQVSAYRRWERAERKVLELKGLRMHRELRFLSARKKELEEKLESATRAEQEISAAVAAASARRADARVALDKARVELDEAHSVVSELEREIGSSMSDLAVAGERLDNVSSRIADLGKRIASRSGKADEFRRRARELAGGEEELKSTLEKARSELKGISGKLSSAEKEFAEVAAELDGARKEFANAAELEREAKAALDEVRRRRETARREIGHLEERRAELSSRLEELRGAVAESVKRSAALEKERDEVLDAISRGSEELAVMDAGIGEAREHVRAMELKVGVLESRLGSLRSAGTAVAGGSSTLSSRIKVKEGYEIAVGAWLDVYQDAVLVDSPLGLPGEGSGARFFVPGRDVMVPGDLPPGGKPLSLCLEEGSDSSVAGLLSGAVLAPDDKTALEWFVEGGNFDIVTNDGNVYRGDGLVRLGVPESGAGSIEREGLISEAERKRGELIKKLAEAEKRIEGLVKRRRELEKALEENRERLTALESGKAAAEALAESGGKQVNILESELSGIDEILPGLLEEASGDVGAEYASRVGEAEDRRKRLSGIMERLEEKKDRLALRLNELLRMENQANLDVSRAENALGKLLDERKRLLESAAGAEEEADRMSSELDSLREEKILLERRIVELENKLARARERRGEAERKRKEASMIRARWLEQSRKADEELAARRDALAVAAEEKVVLSGELRLLEERYKNLDSGELVLPGEKSGYWNLSEEELDAELRKQIGFRESLGPVNMLAVTEYEEGMKRLEFLRKQRNDLEEARISLLGAISDINKTAAGKFGETFARVRENFREMFVSLFGGGEADIMAMESDDPLEGGVQIVARPPGKKMENITSLSDGERAMTAAALLFALYLEKPSPFCVLDELDAPLDDTNVDNYVNLLKRFVDRTQFIVITHNKRTMEAADRLFGITMEERGVSVMTTVNLEKARTLVEG